MIGSIKATQPTWLKQSTAQASGMADADKVAIAPGRVLLVKWIADEVEQGHRRIDLESPLNGRHSWYTFIKHWEVSEVEHPKMEDFLIPAGPTLKGEIVTIPGIGNVGLGDPISPKAPNFTWAEATHNGSRIPRAGDTFQGLSPEQVSRNLVKVFETLQWVRNHYKVPIIINSGYRPPSINRRVGGSSQSRHMYGDAVDFNVTGQSPQSVYRWLDPQWNGGLAASSSFIHLDCRNFKVRWRYQF